MRLSTTSSSLFLAALAMSSSSAALAAPTEPDAGEHAMVSSTSSSMRSIVMAGRAETADVHVGDVSFGGTNHVGANAPHVELHHDRRQFESLLPTLEGLPVVGPILTPLMNKILAALGLQQKGATGAESVQPLTAHQMRLVAQAISDAHEQMQTVSRAAVPVENLAARGTIAEWEAVADQASSASASDAMSTMQRSQTAPSTHPSLPVGLPISLPIGLPISPPVAPPSLPVAPPSLPSSLPVTPPNLPISPPISPSIPNAAGKLPSLINPRAVPPMFVGVKAVDGKFEVSVGTGPATTYTEDSSSTTTATWDSSTTASSEPTSDSTSTVSSSGALFARATSA
ncbi:hypothetical protein DICSQDRAFT_165119 [Dichomitus squalens LYAD-421 SS1]|uniref:uncharacterized protein n=1 Tax=Dichomitus squalens (strain LYAD-421) TaxID=732165 RepID=UPI0004412DDD|nr:uncharacterized protein DICSQDRAFT_165119 [Dichomitus squalens LYAD-421 SS1]EJF67289.1 hypothetical protein DICSQDRAFT_165119 [Dichomitus squalens LYAD-421 SS1]